MFLFSKCKLNLSGFAKPVLLTKSESRVMQSCLSFACTSKDGSNLQDGAGGNTQAGDDLVSAPNSELRQASEQFQAYLVNTELTRKHRLLQVGLQWALLEEELLQTQKHNLIKCNGIQANHKTFHDQKTE